MYSSILCAIGKDCNIFDKVTNKLIKLIVSKRMKKVFLISSLLSIVRSEEKIDDSGELLSQINKLLVLSYNVKTIACNLTISRLIWGDTFLNKIYTTIEGESTKYLKISEVLQYDLDSLELREIGEAIYREIPDWLIYDTKRTIVSDIVYMLHVYKSKV